MNGVRIIRADDPECVRLEREGWVVAARSWAAQLEARSCSLLVLRELAARAGGVGLLRSLTVDATVRVLGLDTATLGDYPGVHATSHEPLTLSRATVSPSRRGHGVLDVDDRLAAMTFVDVESNRAEVDFTVVAPQRRRMGLTTASNHSLGFVVDEEWVTLTPPLCRRTRLPSGPPPR